MNSRIFRIKLILDLVKVMSEMCSLTKVLLIRLIFYTVCTLGYVTLFTLVFTYSRYKSYVFIVY